MYRRGVEDAARGEPHPFYYQHYYQYRRGYDRTSRRGWRLLGWSGGRGNSRKIAMFALMIIVAGLGAFFVLRPRSQVTLTPPIIAAPPTVHKPEPTPTRPPVFPTAAPSPLVVPPTLHVDGMAIVVNTEGAALRGRSKPGIAAPVVATFQEGEQVRLLEGPVQADGYTWWRIESKNGVGWSAQQSQEGIDWLRPAEN